jgi:quinol monooxygenase YgiN
MGMKQLVLLGASLLCVASGPASAQVSPAVYMQLAELEIDAAQLDAYKAAIKEHIQAALAEPGVLSLYAVAHRDNPARITVFEIYRDKDAYESHLEAAHFKRYKATVERMVKSLKLVPVTSVMLGTK